MADKKQEMVYATAANGMTVRIPADKLEQWQKVQDEMRAGTYQMSPEEERREQQAVASMREEIKRRIARARAAQKKSPGSETDR